MRGCCWRPLPRVTICTPASAGSLRASKGPSKRHEPFASCGVMGRVPRTAGTTPQKGSLRQIPPRRRVLVAAINDICALGTLRAVREADREPFTAIVGYDLCPAQRVLAEIRDANSPLIATMRVFPEGYGEKIISETRSQLNGPDSYRRTRIGRRC
jgi:hypothetical protein